MDVRFIEYMPFDGNRWSTGKFFPYQEMLTVVQQRWLNLERIKDAPSDTAKVCVMV